MSIETLTNYLDREPTVDEIRACNFGWGEGFTAGVQRTTSISQTVCLHPSQTLTEATDKWWAENGKQMETAHQAAWAVPDELSPVETAHNALLGVNLTPSQAHRLHQHIYDRTRTRAPEVQS
jgi:hypothetical protein